jgi:hypothetical protein
MQLKEVLELKKPVEISFSSSKFDQQRLSESGGYITFNKKNQPVFKFDNRSSYNKYLELNNFRNQI